ncbi:MAG: hypothetical protein ABSC95_11645 [Acetobacteraceae bacterium]|jgi:hypothetical protein
MATKRDKPAVASVSKAVASRGTPRAVAQPAAVATQAAGGSQRLLREAAWSRMFGRADTKNPFAR